MEESGVSPAIRLSIYQAVRWGGEAAWEQNRTFKELPRFVPTEFQHSWGFESWAEFQGMLVTQGVQNPQPSGRAYCRLGNSKTVPSQ